jgi:hypothetical protein
MDENALSFQEIVVLLIRGAGGKIEVPREYYADNKPYILYAEDDPVRDVRTFYLEEADESE